jgi:transposase-like protein
MNMVLSDRWSKRINEQQASGKSIVGWCKANDLKVNQYYYWRKKLKDNETFQSQKIEWLPVHINPETANLETIKVQLGPATISLEKGFDPELFSQIVQALKAAL